MGGLRLLSYALLIVSAPVCSAYGAGELYPFFPTQYEEHRDITLEVAQSKPNGYFIGVGRSTNIQSAILSVWFPGRSRTLPFSFTVDKNVGNLFKQTKEKVLGYPLPVTYKAEVFKHLDRMLPSDAELGSRPIVLHDYVHSGESMIDLYRIIQDYLQERGRKTEVFVFPIGIDAGIKKVESAAGIKIAGKIELDPNGKHISTAQSYAEFDYDQFAEYESYKPGERKSEALRPRRIYRALVQEVASSMAKDRDAKLAGFLSEHSIQLAENKMLEEMIYAHQRHGQSLLGIVKEKMTGISTRRGGTDEKARDRATARFIVESLPSYLQQDPPFQDVFQLSRNVISINFYAGLHPGSFSPLAESMMELASTPQEYRQAFESRVSQLSTNPIERNPKDHFSQPWVAAEIGAWRRVYQERFGSDGTADLLSDYISQLNQKEAQIGYGINRVLEIIRAVVDPGEQIQYLGEALRVAKATKSKVEQARLTAQMKSIYEAHPEIAKEHAKHGGWGGFIKSLGSAASRCKHQYGSIASEVLKTGETALSVSQ